MSYFRCTVKFCRKYKEIAYTPASPHVQLPPLSSKRIFLCAWTRVGGQKAFRVLFWFKQDLTQEPAEMRSGVSVGSSLSPTLPGSSHDTRAFPYIKNPKIWASSCPQRLPRYLWVESPWQLESSCHPLRTARSKDGVSITPLSSTAHMPALGSARGQQSLFSHACLNLQKFISNTTLLVSSWRGKDGKEQQASLLGSKMLVSFPTLPQWQYQKRPPDLPGSEMLVHSSGDTPIIGSLRALLTWLQEHKGHPFSPSWDGRE